MTNKKPELRVLQVFSTLGIGGAETWLIALLKYFQENANKLPYRVSTHIFVTHGIKDVFDDEACKYGAKIHYAKYNAHNISHFIKTWRSILKKNKFHAIHDHLEHTSGLHFMMGVGYLPKVRIAHVHNPWTHLVEYATNYRRKLSLVFGKLGISFLGSHILGTSKQLIQELGFQNPIFFNLKKDVAHCGFETRYFIGDNKKMHKSLCNEFNLPKNAKIALFVGRLDSNQNERYNQKNPMLAIESAKQCIEMDPNFYLIMAGNCSDSAKNKYSKILINLKIQDQVRILGSRSDVPRLMMGSDLFLLTSIAEGLGMVVVEAQSAGLPCVISSSTPKEAVVEPSLIHTVPLNATPGIWAQKINEIIYKKRPDPLIGNRAVRKSGFSIENSASKLIYYYSKGLNFAQ